MVFVLGFLISKYLYDIWDDNLKDIGSSYLAFTIIELFVEMGFLLDFLTK